MNVENLQEEVDRWIKEHGVKYFDPMTNLAQLVEEVGELARVMSRRFGMQSSKEGEAHLSMEEELADILFVVACLANQNGINLRDAFLEKLKKKTLRDQNRHKNNPKLQ